MTGCSGTVDQPAAQALQPGEVQAQATAVDRGLGQYAGTVTKGQVLSAKMELFTGDVTTYRPNQVSDRRSQLTDRVYDPRTTLADETSASRDVQEPRYNVKADPDQAVFNPLAEVDVINPSDFATTIYSPGDVGPIGVDSPQ